MRRAWTVVSICLVFAACGGSAASPAPDAGTDAAVDDSSLPDTGPDDGTPNYTSACTPLSQQTGTAINTQHGRLDGTLAFIVPKGGSAACNGDDSHVHLQVRAGGEIYDVAVDIGKFVGDVDLYEADMPMPDGPWAEGWHGNDGLSYVQQGLHSTQFTPEDPTALGKQIETELAGANHVSVFGTGYTQGNGCHQIHFYGAPNDGALVVHPLSSPAHILFFRFSTQSF